MKRITKYLTLFIMTFAFILNINAASGKITVSTNKSSATVGSTINATITISSGSPLGAWEWVIDYDKSKLKLTSGKLNIADVGDGKIKGKSYKYSFKAIAKGTATITVKSVGALDWNKNNISISKGSKSIKIITQAELEASYSKDNTLKSLSVDGYDLSPTFSKNETNYKVEVPSDTTKVNINARKNDSSASVNGDGEHEVSEGENKFVITVTAENGSTKEYTIIVSVVDPNPINVKINDKNYVIVKRTSSIEKPDGFEFNEIELDEQKVPSLYNEVTKLTLLGLKDEEGNIKLYLYNKNDNSYKEYNEISFEKIKILPLDIDKKFDNSYKQKNIKKNKKE